MTGSDEIRIEARELTKDFGNFRAVDEVSFQVKKGEILGFLGLNGAGKTTTIGMLLGLIRPVSGESWILGENVRPGFSGPWDKVGSLIETPGAYDNLTVKENLELIRRIRRLKSGDIDSIMDGLSLTQYTSTKAGNLSLGNRQRLGLARALIHNPDVLLLDEPSNGLDPRGIIEIRELLLDLARKRDVTILISSHNLSEVSLVADRICIIHNGRVIRQIRIDEVHDVFRKRLYIKTNDNDRVARLLDGHGFVAQIEGEEVSLGDISALLNPHEVSRMIVKEGFELHQLCERGENLEQYFSRVIEESKE